MEERTIDLPLAGTVQLTIIWTSPGPANTMDLLEQTIRRLEATMGFPFPRRQVIYKIEPDGPRRGVLDDQYVYLGGDASMERLEISVGHETAHYYWMWPSGSWLSPEANLGWVSEGAAEFLSILHKGTIPGVVSGSVCDLNIAQVEQLPFGGSPCWYGVGHRFYYALYDTMDEANFRLGLRRWYLHTRFDTPVCDGDTTTYCRVMEAFTTYASERNRAAVEDVINRRYGVMP